MRLPRGMTKKGNRYYARLYSGGLERSVPLGCDVGKAAESFYRLRAGADPAAERGVSVREAGERWLQEYVGTSRNEKGQAMARVRFETGFARFIGHSNVRDVTRADVRRYRLHLETGRKDLTASTVGHYLSDVRCFLHWCEDAGLVDRAPVPARLLPRVQEQPPDRLSDAEVAAIVSLPDPWGFVARFALSTGLRWGELTRAKRTDVTPDGWLEVSQTKSGRMRRVPLNRDILEEILARKGALVPFATLSPGSYSKAVRAKTGQRTFHVHQTRHTFACRWLEAGGSLDSLQRVLGHQDQRTTRRYGQPSDRYVREEALRVFAALTGKETGKSGSHITRAEPLNSF